jgi:hypothetical protein
MRRGLGDSQTYRRDDDDKNVGGEQIGYPKCEAQDHAKHTSPIDSLLACPVLRSVHIRKALMAERWQLVELVYSDASMGCNPSPHSPAVDNGPKKKQRPTIVRIYLCEEQKSASGSSVAHFRPSTGYVDILQLRVLNSSASVILTDG